MEPLLPIDLDPSQFHAKLRGYDRREVDALLAKASDRMNQAIQELYRVREQVEVLENALNTLREERATPSIADDGLAQAAERRQQAQKELEDLQWQIEKLKLEKKRFIEGFKRLLEAQVRELTEALHGASGAQIQSAESLAVIQDPSRREAR